MKSLISTFLIIFICFTSYGNKVLQINPESIFLLQRQGKLMEAEKMAQTWVSKVKSQYGNKSIEIVIPLLVKSELAIHRREFHQAIEILDESLEIMDNSSGWLYPDYAIALNYKAFCLINLGDINTAFQLINEAEIVYVKTISKQTPNYNFCIFNRAIAYLHLHDFAKSEEYFQKSLEFIQNEKGDIDRVINVEWIKLNLADLYTKWYKTDQSIKMLEELKAKQQSENMLLSPLYRDIMESLGDAYFIKNDYKSSFIYYDHCINITKETLGENHPSNLKIYTKIARTLKEQNYFNNALKYYETVSSKFNKTNGDINLYIEALLNIADIHLQRGNTKLASNFLNKSNDYKAQNRELEFLKLRLDGEIDFINGDYISAELKIMELISQVRQEQIYFTKHYSDAIALLGELFIVLGRTNEAIEFCQSELRFMKRRNMEQSMSYYNVELSLLSAQLRNGERDTEEILNDTENVIESISLNLNPQHKLLIKALSIQGRIASKNRNFNEALAFFDKADEIGVQQKISDKQYQRLEILDSKGNIYLDSHEYDLALKEFEKLQGIFSNSSIYKPGILARIAYTKSLQGKWSEAEALIIEAVNLRFKQYDQQLKFTSEDEKINYIHHSSGVFTYFFSMMSTKEGIRSPIMNAECYNIHNNYRKYFLHEAITRKNKINQLSNYRASVQFTNYTTNLQLLKSKLATANFLSVKERDTLNIDTYINIDQINNLEKSLVYAADNSSDSLQLTKTYTWEDTQKQLDDNEVAIEILKLKNIIPEMEIYAAIIISPKIEIPKFVPIGNAMILENQVFEEYSKLTTRSKRSLIMSKQSDTKKIDPYNFYWKPIKDELDKMQLNHDKIYLSKDGIFHGINLNILKNPNSGKFVIEDELIYLVISTSGIKRKERKEIKNKEILLVGNPIFEPSDSERELDTMRSTENNTNTDEGYSFYLNNLPGTEKEINKIEKMFKENDWKVSKLQQEEATENNIKSIQNSPYVIHIATHGFYLDELNNPIINNELLKSGLFFTEISERENRSIEEIYDSGNDGILTAYEVKGLNLEDTELLVLSACQTGVSDISAGDGISGLQYAFSIAGVNTIIMSLWSVDDVATQKLMSEFYKQLFITKDKRAAFKMAQLSLKKEYPQPYYWGAFLMID